MTPRVELIYDQGCPNVGAARRALLAAFERAGSEPRWKEWDRKTPESPDYVRAFGSPTVLVEGRDVAGGDSASAGESCRLYDHGGKLKGVPPEDLIAEAIAAAAAKEGSGWRGLLPMLPGMGAVALPTCAACVPALAGVFGAVGLGFLLEESVLLPLMAGLLLLTLFILGFRARRRRGYGPLAAGVGATAIIAAGKFFFASDVVLYAGLAFLVAATLWNAWPRKKTEGVANGEGCPRCP